MSEEESLPIAELEALLAKAKMPWSLRGILIRDSTDFGIGDFDLNLGRHDPERKLMGENNAALAVAAVNALPSLIAVAKLAKELVDAVGPGATPGGLVDELCCRIDEALAGKDGG